MRILTVISFLIFTQLAFGNSKTKIENIDFQNNAKGESLAVIKYTGELLETPELSFGENHIQVKFSQAVVWPKIEKKINDQSGELTLTAYQFDKDTVRMRAIYPQQIKANENQVNLSITKGEIILTMPKVKIVENKIVPVQIKKEIVSDEKYDESYLQQLIQANNKTGHEIKNNQRSIDQVKPEADAQKKQDQVQVVQSSVVKNNPVVPFSIGSYVGKFLAFIGLVLVLFYGVVQIFKKGTLGRNKLGFMKNTPAISVISTTFIAPKKSLMVVKVQDQVLLLANSDSGIQFLTEIKNAAGILKETEKSIAGNNFDSQLSLADEVNNLEDRVKVKQNIETSKEMVTLDSTRRNFTNQLKNKVKNLKPLQS